MRKSSLILIAVLALGGCATPYGEGARMYAGAGAAKAVKGACLLNDTERQKNLNTVNEELAEAGVAHRACSMDCNGDDKPDLGC